MTPLLINTIYLATEGEGVRLGTPQVFVRFQGCTRCCLNCDSKDTWDFEQGKGMTVLAVMQEVQRLAPKMKRISITGGDTLDPRHIEGVYALAQEARAQGYFINLEASGHCISRDIFSLVDFISMDVKTPSSGTKSPPECLDELCAQFSNKFQIKSVIENRADFDYVLAIRAKQNCGTAFPWVLTPAYNLQEKFPMERFKAVLHWNEEAGGLFRVIGQQHKWIFGPDAKCV